MQMPAFVLVRDHVAWAKYTCESLDNLGLKVVIVDNNSTYPEMCKWLNSKRSRGQYKVINICRDMGHVSPYMLWLAKVREYASDSSGSLRGYSDTKLVNYYMKYYLGYNGTRYIVTDSDLKFNIGPTFLDICNRILDSDPSIAKVGPTLHWQDHEEPWHKYEFIDEVQKFESRHFAPDIMIGSFEHKYRMKSALHSLLEGFKTFEYDAVENVVMYNAPIDTTFAMYSGVPFQIPGCGKCVRVEADQTSFVHRPWTLPMGSVFEDKNLLYYVLNCGSSVGMWTNKMRGLILDRIDFIEKEMCGWTPAIRGHLSRKANPIVDEVKLMEKRDGFDPSKLIVFGSDDVIIEGITPVDAGEDVVYRPFVYYRDSDEILVMEDENEQG